MIAVLHNVNKRFLDGNIATVNSYGRDQWSSLLNITHMLKQYAAIFKDCSVLTVQTEQHAADAMTRFDTNRAVQPQPQKIDRGLKFSEL